MSDNELITSFMKAEYDTDHWNTDEITADRQYIPGLNISWNYVMPIIDKIEDGDIKFYIFENTVWLSNEAYRQTAGGSKDSIHFEFKGKNKLKSIYFMCLKYITWHNANYKGPIV